MIFISYAQMAKDVVAWSEQLPRDIDVFVGIPRSGLLAANLLALHRNVALSSLDAFATLHFLKGGQRDKHSTLKKVMVVDDSMLSGKSLKGAQEKLAHIHKIEVYFGALYAQPGKLAPNWFAFKEIPVPRIFEWNLFHGYWIQRACVDIDGVLCRDPTTKENDDGLQYKKFLHTVAPRHVPTVPIHTLVTCRLEKYRDDTVAWLRKHGIVYKNLVMHSAATKKERQRRHDYAYHKIKAFKASGCPLFLESDPVQAKDIAQGSLLPVICTDTMVQYG